MATTSKVTHPEEHDPEAAKHSFWDSIKDEETAVEYNKVSKAFLGPPIPDRPFEVMNAITYTRGGIERVHDNHRTLPALLEVDDDLVDSKADEKSYPCQIVQLSSLNQFVIIDDDVYRITGCSADGLADKSGSYFEARIKFDYAKSVDDQELINAVKELLCKQ